MNKFKDSFFYKDKLFLQTNIDRMELLNKVEDYIKELYATHPHELLLFHNSNYTNQVVKCARELAVKENFSEENLHLTILASWFLNIGYLFDFVEHTKQSVRIAELFLNEIAYPESKKMIILNAIEKVLKNKKPANEIEKVLADANNAIFASKEFVLWVKYHRQERNYFVKPKITKRNFWQNISNLLNEHEYYTYSAKRMFREGKAENIEKINQFLSEQLNSELPKNNQIIIQELQAEIEKINQKVEKRITSARGYDSLYRITARNQINLSGIADNKAHILITLNTLIISAVITFVYSQIADVKFIEIPVLLTVVSSLFAIGFAVIATRPHILPGEFKMKDFYEKKTNLIFYGNFYNMNYDEYDRAVRDMLKDQELLFSNLNRDQYELGKILGRKFRLLHYSYTIFLYGFIISALSFLIILFLL